jgi:hypothetical protein
MLSQNLLAEGVDFHERDRFEPARPFQADVKTADSCE